MSKELATTDNDIARIAEGLWGVRIIENPILTIPAEDWSQVRSPSRAERRRRQGHKQRIRFYQKPDRRVYTLPDGSLVMHPVIASALRQYLEQRND